MMHSKYHWILITDGCAYMVCRDALCLKLRFSTGLKSFYKKKLEKFSGCFEVEVFLARLYATSLAQFLALNEEMPQEESLDLRPVYGFGEAENVSYLHQLLAITLCAAPHSSSQQII